jgi:hypothetical protein
MSKDDFLANKRTQQAVILNLIVIGETATKLLKDYGDFLDQYSDVPWRNMKGMRNRIAHGYFDINLDVVWDTAQTADFAADSVSYRHPAGNRFRQPDPGGATARTCEGGTPLAGVDPVFQSSGYADANGWTAGRDRPERAGTGTLLAVSLAGPVDPCRQRDQCGIGEVSGGGGVSRSDSAGKLADHDAASRPV